MLYDANQTLTLRVFTPFLKSPYLPDKVYNVMIPFATETSKVFEITVNLKELEQEQTEYVVSPNPFNEIVNVEIKNTCSDCEEHKYKLILTMDGINDELVQDITTGTNNINTIDVHPGSYYFLIKNLSGALVKSGQIIKQ